MGDVTLSALWMRIGYTPIAFRLLPPRFTLVDPQQTYEMQLRHRSPAHATRAGAARGSGEARPGVASMRYRNFA